MTVPTLPPDIWFRITTLLSPPELSSLSQVNQTLHKVATDETHFRRVLAIPQPRTKPSIAYRRLHAFSSPPTSTEQRLSERTNILCIVENILILIDTITERLITFPTAHTVNINDLLDRKCWKKGHVLPNEVRKRYTVLPDARIAFLKGSNPTHLTVLDIRTWDMHKHEIPGKRCETALLRGSNVFTAGNQGEWIIYTIDKETAVLVDWRQGIVIRTVKTVRRALTSKWLWGTCPKTKVRSIVGVVSQETDRSKNLIRATGFDGLEVVFERDRDRPLYSVLRSSDTNTHVVLTRQPVGSFGSLQFWAHRELSNSQQTWSGELVSLIYTKLIINGNVIEAVPQGYLQNKTFATSAFAQHFVVLEDDGAMQSTCSPRPVRGSQMVWSKRTSDSGLAVIGGGSNSVKVVKLKRVPGSAKLYQWIFEDYDPEEPPLHRWSVPGLVNLCVLADHVVVAITADGHVKSFHFDRFCRDGGAYACPWVRTLQSFRWPEQTCVAEPDSPPRKKRRTASRASHTPGNDTM